MKGSGENNRTASGRAGLLEIANGGERGRWIAKTSAEGDGDGVARGKCWGMEMEMGLVEGLCDGSQDGEEERGCGVAWRGVEDKERTEWRRSLAQESEREEGAD